MSALLMEYSDIQRRGERSDRRLKAQEANVARLEREIRAMRLLARKILEVGKADTEEPEGEEQPDDS